MIFFPWCVVPQTRAVRPRSSYSLSAFNPVESIKYTTSTRYGSRGLVRVWHVGEVFHRVKVCLTQLSPLTSH